MSLASTQYLSTTAICLRIARCPKLGGLKKVAVIASIQLGGLPEFSATSHANKPDHGQRSGDPPQQSFLVDRYGAMTM